MNQHAYNRAVLLAQKASVAEVELCKAALSCWPRSGWILIAAEVDAGWFMRPDCACIVAAIRAMLETADDRTLLDVLRGARWLMKREPAGWSESARPGGPSGMHSDRTLANWSTWSACPAALMACILELDSIRRSMEAVNDAGQ